MFTKEQIKDFIKFVNQQISLVDKNKDNVQTVANNMAKSLANGNDVYSSVLTTVNEESMGMFQQVMASDDFKANGASKKDIDFMKHSGDNYFTDKSYDGATPYTLTAHKCLDDLKTYRDTARDMIA